MKNTERVHKKGRAPHAAPQVQTPSTKAGGRRDDFIEKFLWQAAGVPEMSKRSARAERERTRAEYVLLTQKRSWRNAANAFAEMDMAIIQCNGLMQLLADNLHYRVIGEGSSFSEEEDSMCAGIMELVRANKTRLTSAFDTYRRLTHDRLLPASVARAG